MPTKLGGGGGGGGQTEKIQKENIVLKANNAGWLAALNIFIMDYYRQLRQVKFRQINKCDKLLYKTKARRLGNMRLHNVPTPLIPIFGLILCHEELRCKTRCLCKDLTIPAINKLSRHLQLIRQRDNTNNKIEKI